MEKPSYCVNSEESFQKMKRIREKYRESGVYDRDVMIPRITGDAAEMLVAQLRAHDRFRSKSLEIHGGKVIG